jgi:hypothetical protein
MLIKIHDMLPLQILLIRNLHYSQFQRVAYLSGTQIIFVLNVEYLIDLYNYYKL